MIPRWFERRIERWIAGKKTGAIRVNFKDGAIRTLQYEEGELAPTRTCDACQDEMEEKDRGTVLVCPTCGRKAFPK